MSRRDGKMVLYSLTDVGRSLLHEADRPGGRGMSPVQLPLVSASVVPPRRTDVPRQRDESWLRDARRARALSWASLAWMTVEGVAGLIAGLDANALSVIVWAASSFVEGLASMIVIWRFTGARTMSDHSERTAQRLVAGSFLLLIPFFVYEAIHRLIAGSDMTSSVWPLRSPHRRSCSCRRWATPNCALAQRLGSGATAGEGVQNLMCASSGHGSAGSRCSAPQRG